MKQLHRYLLLLVCFAWIGIPAFSQPTKLHKASEDEIYQKAVALLDFSEYASLPLTGNAPIEQIAQLFQYNQVTFDSLERQLLQEKIRYIEKDYGLRLSARFNHNGDRDDELLDPGSRWKGGVEWDLLNGGFFDRKRKSSAVKKDLEIRQLEHLLDSRQNNYPYLYNKIIYSFNQRKIDLLHQRIPFLESLLDVMMSLYYIHGVNYAEVLDVKKSLEESKVMLMSYEDFNRSFRKIVEEDTILLDAQFLPILEIDIDRLLKDSASQLLVNTLIDKKQEAVAFKHNSGKLPNLRLYSHYNIRTNDGGFDRSFGSVGALLSLPLNFNGKEQRSTQHLEKEIIQQKTLFQAHNNTKELLNLVHEYNYKMKQYVRFLHKKARMEEKLRVEKVLLNYDQRGHSPLMALNHKDLILELELELNDITQMMYLKLAKLATKSNLAEFVSCLKVRSFEDVGQKFKGDRCVTLREKDLGDNFSFTINYLQKNEFKSVHLPGITSAKVIEKLKDANIQILTPDEFKSDKRSYRQVHMNQFDSRTDLEFWITSTYLDDPDQLYLFESLEELINLDRQSNILAIDKKRKK